MVKLAVLLSVTFFAKVRTSVNNTLPYERNDVLLLQV